MELVQRFKDGIAWYQPTTDTDSWRYFYDHCYSVDYTKANAETLKRVAWECAKLQTTVDVGMWAARKQRLMKFLSSNMAMNDYDPVLALAVQYEFIACFLNDYSAASHNNDLWQSINDSALGVLQEKVPLTPPPRAHANAAIGVNPKWLLAGIPLILYGAFKTINISWYKPTVDTDTWAYFQQVMFDLDLLDNVYITFNHTYLLSNISSPVDSGMWGTLAAGATTFLDVNLGQANGTADSQVDLAINFCDQFKFNYKRAAHNNNLFKTYNESFSDAAEKLQLLKQGH